VLAVNGYGISNLSCGATFYDPRGQYGQYSMGTTQSIVLPIQTYFSLEVMTISDVYGLVGQTCSSESCRQGYADVLSDPAHPYHLYSPIVTTTPLTNPSCDVATDPNAQLCAGNIYMQIASNVVQTMESVPDIAKLDIWLNAGAIVGAVQFFAWFLVIWNM
jgi:hypothetical protein